MGNKATTVLRALGKAFIFGLAAGAAMGLLAFLFGALTSGPDWVLGGTWAMRLLYVLGAVGIVASGAGLLFSGNEYRDARIGFAKDETLRNFAALSGVSWPWALLAASAALLVPGTAVDLLV